MLLMHIALANQSINFYNDFNDDLNYTRYESG